MPRCGVPQRRLDASQLIPEENLQVLCRTDYQLATPGLAATARSASVYKDSWFSDHAPLTVDYDFKI